MRGSGSRSSPSPTPTTEARPPVCPSCRSTATVTSGARPDADSYWRCTDCGEIWNVARAQVNRYGARRWS